VRGALPAAAANEPGASCRVCFGPVTARVRARRDNYRSLGPGGCRCRARRRPSPRPSPRGARRRPACWERLCSEQESLLS
jgi:hypothetical protein